MNKLNSSKFKKDQSIEDILTENIDLEWQLEKDEVLLEPGDAIVALYIVLDGIMVLSQPITNGRELFLRLCKKGHVIGDLTLFSKPIDKQVLFASAFRKSVVGIIYKETLDQLIKTNEQISHYIMNEMSENSLRDKLKLVDLVMYGKKGALYSTLIRLANSYGVVKDKDIYINLSLTNQELANFCGSTRENINRLLKELRQKKIVSVKNKHITIHQIDYLKKQLNCDTCPISLCSIH